MIKRYKKKPILNFLRWPLFYSQIKRSEPEASEPLPEKQWPTQKIENRLKRGVLLINLGTPRADNAPAIRRYLKDFLNDPRVIDLPKMARWLLVNFFIIPLRLKKTTEAYQKIKLANGFPLLIYSLQLQQALMRQLGEKYQVELGMRYGEPSIESALEKLKGCSEIRVLPLFPQYASATTGSAVEKVFHFFKNKWNIPSLEIKKDFYNHSSFIHAYANLIRATLTNKKIDKILFSYHGLPERHIIKSDCRAACDHQQACPTITEANAYCYRAQCYSTSQALAQALNLPFETYETAFQSRLGKTPWIKPYTDVILSKFIEQGVRKLAVVCPSFVTDCLETLEEINIRLREQWIKLGGEELIYIPCLNNHPSWVEAIKKILNL